MKRLPASRPRAKRTAGDGKRGVTAYERVREAIASGTLKPGARVVESELAALLDMSRTPIREAVAMLEADGLVSTDGPRGRRVATLDYQSVMELYAVREVLESSAAGMAARGASDIEVAALRHMLTLEAQLVDAADALADHNRRFHEAICLFSHNRYIARMLQHVQTGMLLIGPITRLGNERVDTALAEHTAVVDAIEARDEAAAKIAMRHHIRRAQEARVKLLLEQR